MSYFLSAEKLSDKGIVELGGDEAAHILLSRRMKPGEVIQLQDPEVQRYEAKVVKAGKKSVTVQILRQVPVPVELSVPITLFQSFVQEKALDFILQKSTELGAAKIVLFNSARTATNLSADQFAKKQERWTKILWESAKQSGRARIPELKFLLGFNEVMAALPSFDKTFLCDASGSSLQTTSYHLQSLSVIVGPEGGFTEQEIDFIKSLPNIQTIKLSPFTLRAETAALAALAVLQ